MLQVTNVGTDIFLNSSTVQLIPAVSAEWNQNLFNQPYLTVAGTGIKYTGTIVDSSAVSSVSGSTAHPNFETHSFPTSYGSGSVAYTFNTGVTGLAYKIVTYAMTDDASPVMLSAYAQGASTQYGSKTVDINSFGWTKVELYIGSNGGSDTFSSFTLNLQINPYSSSDANPTIYYTTPEVYQTTYFDYQYGSLWPSDSPFTYFRPGESYVDSGDRNHVLPDSFRPVKTQILQSQTVDSNKNVINPPTFPITPIIENPSFSAVSVPSPFYKNLMPSDMSAYKYFVSDSTTKSISAIYASSITCNKIVIKLNKIMTNPTVSVSINGGSPITVFNNGASSTSITPDANGLIVLYATTVGNSTTWSTSKWSTMPKFNLDGTLSNYLKINKITVTQLTSPANDAFSTYTSRSSNAATDMSRMHLVEVSPRLEIDLSDYTMQVDINKSLDSKTSTVPISSINTDDASIILSAIPISLNNSLVPLFSSQSNLAINVLSSMLRKNIKFYISWNLIANFDPANKVLTSVNKYVPGGVFYSDTWDETDVKTVKIQCFDATRYLQTMPAPDYVANLKSVFEVITNILDLAGYTDYDYDSLYKVCNNNSTPLDLAYYYCNSKDTTIYDALSQIFIANQIGAYIDEYNVMRFLSLSQILSNKTSSLTINDAQIVEGGYQISNKAKPGKISVRYQSPKIKQSLALQNASSFSSQTDPSFIYTTSNDVVWAQQNSDSVGFNHLSESFAVDENKYKINVNDALNVFHTFSLNNDGYAVIENEIVSFLYKEYEIFDNNGSTPVFVSVKNDLELQAEINRFVKKNESGLALSLIDDLGNAMKPVNANVTVTPTGWVTNVQRGLFGTKCDDHYIISDLDEKNLKEATINSSLVFADQTTGTNTKIVNNNINDVFSNVNVPSVEKIQITTPASTKVVVYPNERDQGYKTYSAKFDMFDYTSPSIGSAGIFFNQSHGGTTDGTYFVELVKFTQSNPKLPLYKYIIVLSKIVSGASKVIAFSEITSTAYNIIGNFEKIIYKNPKSTATDVQHQVTKIFNINPDINPFKIELDDVTGISPKMYVQGHGVDGATQTAVSSVSGNTVTFTKPITSIVGDILTFSPYTYNVATDQTFNLKVNHYYNDASITKNGDPAGELIEVFLNNIEIMAWQVPGVPRLHELYYGWQSTGKNTVTGLSKKISISDTSLNTSGKDFGFFMSTSPTKIQSIVVAYVGYELESNTVDLFTYPTSTTSIVGNLREIYACGKLLNERSVSYWFQDREFLNGLVQGQNIFSKYKSYMMQTNPEIIGINYYDVQYTTPAAVSVDVLPVEYLWYYFPGNEPKDQQFYQTQLVDEYSLAYSTPINTGFRAKLAIANNSSHMVYLKKDSDSLNQFAINLNLWTHEIIAQSDPAIIERVIDQSNIAEVIQLDSQWIQSKEIANKLLTTIEKGVEGFSKDTTMEIFGNPLIQVGDVITVTYSLAGLNQQKYIVHSVAQTFNQGLKTTLTLNMLDQGLTY